MQAKAKLREGSTLFARLPEGAVRTLKRKALKNIDNRTAATDRKHSYSHWNIHEATSDNTKTGECNFLPLSITYYDARGCIRTVYASYNGGLVVEENLARGGAGADVDVDCVIELPASIFDDTSSAATVDETNDQSILFSSVGVSDTTVVHIQPLSMIYDAKSVEFLPLKVEDWEILEMHAETLEAGIILSQVTIIFPGQIIPLEILTPGNSTVVARVKVMQFTGDLSAEKTLRLIQNTEVSVRPLSRRNASDQRNITSFDPSTPLRSFPTIGDVPKEMLGVRNEVFQEYEQFCKNEFGCDAKFKQTPLPSILPFSVCIHPDTWKLNVPGSSHECAKAHIAMIWRLSDDTDGGEKTPPNKAYNANKQQSILGGEKCFSTTVVVRVFQTNDVPRGHIAIHPDLRYQMGLLLLDDYAVLQLCGENQLRHARGGLTSAPVLNFLFSLVTSRDDDISSTSKNSPAVPDGLKVIKNPIIPIPNLSLEQSYRASEVKLIASEWINNLPNHRLPITFPALFIYSNKEDTRASWLVSIEGRDQSTENASKNDQGRYPPSFLYTSDLTLEAINSKIFKWSVNDNATELVPLKQGYTFRLCPEIRSVIGVREQIGFVMQYLSHYLSSLPMEQSVPGIVVSGEKGTGKTHVLHTVSTAVRIGWGVASVYLDCKHLRSSSYSMDQILNKLSAAFSDALDRAPAMLVLDGLDELAPHLGEEEIKNSTMCDQAKIVADHVRYLQRYVASEVIKDFEKMNKLCLLNKETLCSAMPAVAILCSCETQHSLHQSLRTAGRFDMGVHLPLPDTSTRTDLFVQILEKTTGSILSRNDLNHISWARQSEGFKPLDLVSIANRAKHVARLRLFGRLKCRSPISAVLIMTSKLSISTFDVETALSHFVPVSLQNAHLSEAKVRWRDVGGLEQGKRELIDCVVKPVIFKKVYDLAPIKLPKGVMLFGPSGCGKSFVAEALANKSGLNLITCKGPELLDKYIGASEAAVRTIFQRAYSAAPSLLFFDEFEALAPKRGTDNTGVTDRVVNQLLTFLDGVETAPGTVYVVAATSRPDLIDAALLRPGRLDKHVYIGFPENMEERIDILQRLSTGKPLSDAALRTITSGSLIKSFNNAAKLSPSDFKAILDTAHLEAIHARIDIIRGDGSGDQPSNYSSDDGENGVIITEEHLLKSLRECRPSVSDADRAYYDRIHANFRTRKKQEEGDSASGPPNNIFSADKARYPNINDQKTALR